MKKLKYNIYLNISDEEYIEVQDRLILIENKISKMLNDDKWGIKTSVIHNDGLNLNFFTQEIDFYGSLSLVFQDTSHISFTLSISKSFDESNCRYLLRYDVFSNKEINFFENDIFRIINEALEKYKSWSKKDIYELGLKINLSDFTK